jgi:hypothetical protein
MRLHLRFKTTLHIRLLLPIKLCFRFLSSSASFAALVPNTWLVADYFRTLCPLAGCCCWLLLVVLAHHLCFVLCVFKGLGGGAGTEDGEGILT